MVLRICPSCGVEFEGDLCAGCLSCGARAVGPPLAKPEHELPSYSRALVAVALGALMCVGLLLATIVVLTQTRPISLRFWAIEYAGETAVWNLKWVELPIVIAVLWISLRMVRGIKQAPGRFAGLRAARSGLLASALVTAAIATLIGVTIPERLLARQLRIDAAVYAKSYRILRALNEYRELHGFIPAQDELLTELKTLPDPDGSIAEAVESIDPKGYNPMAVTAAASTKVKLQNLRGGALRDAATSLNGGQPENGVTFTTYELRLPGEDKILGTPDDFIVRDGVIMKVSELPQQPPPFARSNAP